MKNFGNIIIGDAARFSFENRVFNFVSLLGVAMTSAGILSNWYFGTPFIIDLFFAGFCFVSYYLSRFAGGFKVMAVLAVGVLVFAYIPYMWLSSEGSQSAIPYYSIIFIAAICIILRGRIRLIMVVSMMLIDQLLIILEAGSIEASLHMPYINTSIVLAVMTCGMAVLIILYSNTYMKEKARSEDYAKTIEEQYKQQLYYMENLEELIYKLKSERHDFNNHLGVIYGLLENGETENATSYASQLIKTAEEYRNIADLPYSMIRAMLNYKLSGAREDGIELRLDIHVPEGLPLNEFDLTVILGNLLDNAVEGCKNVDADKRYIRLELTYKPDYLVLQIENPLNRAPVKKGGAYRTTKPDFDAHGFGLNNIAYLVSRHNGLIKIEPEGGVFRVGIALLAK